MLSSSLAMATLNICAFLILQELLQAFGRVRHSVRYTCLSHAPLTRDLFPCKDACKSVLGLTGDSPILNARIQVSCLLIKDLFCMWGLSPHFYSHLLSCVPCLVCSYDVLLEGRAAWPLWALIDVFDRFLLSTWTLRRFSHFMLRRRAIVLRCPIGQFIFAAFWPVINLVIDKKHNCLDQPLWPSSHVLLSSWNLSRMTYVCA